MGRQCKSAVGRTWYERACRRLKASEGSPTITSIDVESSHISCIIVVCANVGGMSPFVGASYTVRGVCFPFI